MMETLIYLLIFALAMFIMHRGHGGTGGCGRHSHHSHGRRHRDVSSEENQEVTETPGHHH